MSSAATVTFGGSSNGIYHETFYQEGDYRLVLRTDTAGAQVRAAVEFLPRPGTTDKDSGKKGNRTASRSVRFDGEPNRYRRALKEVSDEVLTSCAQGSNTRLLLLKSSSNWRKVALDFLEQARIHQDDMITHHLTKFDEPSRQDLGRVPPPAAKNITQ